jgi:hypothetical protein
MNRRPTTQDITWLLDLEKLEKLEKWGDMIHIHLNFNCSAVEFRLPVCGGMEAPGPSQVSS